MRKMKNKLCWRSNHVPHASNSQLLPTRHWCFLWHVIASMLCIQHRSWVLFLSISQSLNHFSPSCNWTITSPFMADLINFYEKKGLQVIEWGSIWKVLFSFKSLTPLQFFFFIVVYFHYYFSFQSPHNGSFSLLFFSFDYHITVSFPTKSPNPIL